MGAILFYSIILLLLDEQVLARQSWHFRQRVSMSKGLEARTESGYTCACVTADGVV